MNSFEPLSFGEKKENTQFTGLQVDDQKETEFIPFGVYGGEIDPVKGAKKRVAILEQEGYEKGFAQGQNDGFEMGEKKALKVIENVENLLIEMNRFKFNILKRHEKEILEIIFAIAEKIIHYQIDTSDEIIKESIVQALRLTVDKSQVVLRVNPEDYDYVEKLRPDLFSKIKDMKSIIVNSDTSISRGGCFLETNNGDVDATVETQLEKIRHCLTRTFTEKEDV